MDGSITQYWFDPSGRKSKTISPDTGTTKFLYDEAGNLKQKTDAKGTVVNYTYDALNRLTSVQFPSDPSQNITYIYDSLSVTYGIGRLTGMTDPSGTYAFHYDAQGNLSREEKNILGINYITQYAYDKNNILSSITYPSGRTVTYVPDGARRVGEITTTLNGQPKTLASSISYLPYGGITGLTYGNNLTLSQGYDNQYRISSIVAGSVLNRSYDEYFPNGNVKKITDVLESTWELPSEPTKDYSYNPGTNKLAGIQGGTPVTFGYDSNGNITSANTRTYIYDLSNQLTHIIENSVQIAEYVFNGFGQRIKKSAQSGIRTFHYDPWGHLIAETNQSGQMIAEYVYLGDQLLAIIKPGESAYYFHNDHLGTPQVLTDANGNVAWKAVYMPFGGTQILVESVENPFRFPGQYYDQETGLHYNYFRHYSPGIGRYLTPDPIGLRGGINLFTYVQGDPINFIDPYGLEGGYWQYSQSTGMIAYVDVDWSVTYYGRGYSGLGWGRDNPDWQDIRDIGPIPQGLWYIGPQRPGGDLGPAVMNLSPMLDTNTFNRTLFRVHGDNPCECLTASTGCIILSRDIRDLINNSGDRTLKVIR